MRMHIYMYKNLCVRTLSLSIIVLVDDILNNNTLHKRNTQ
jgi:hypothetical protein